MVPVPAQCGAAWGRAFQRQRPAPAYDRRIRWSFLLHAGSHLWSLACAAATVRAPHPIV